MAGTGNIGYATLSVIPSAVGFGAALTSQIAPGMAGAGAAGGASLLGALKKALPVAAVAAAVGSLFAIGQTFAGMDNTIRAGTGDVGAALASLTESARNVGRRVPSSFADIGTTVTGLHQRLGLTGPVLETLSRQFLVAGRITKESLDMGTITASMTIFNIAGAETTTAMDTLFQVSQATGVGMNELASAVQKGAPVLQQFGFSFSDSAALMGTLDKAGIATSTTLMALKIGLVNFAKAGKDPQVALKDTITSIEDFTKAGNDAEALTLAASIFGTRGATQFVAAVKSGTLNLDDLMAAAGAGNDTILGAGTAVSTFGSKWAVFKNNVLIAIEPIATRVFKAFGDGMQFMNDTGLPALQAFGSEMNDRLAPAFTAIGAFITGSAIPSIQSFIAEFRNGEGAGGTFRTMLEGLWNNVLVPLAGFVTGTLVPAIGSIAAWIRDTGVPALVSFKDWVGKNTTTVKIIAGVITTLLLPGLIHWGVQSTIAGAKSVAAWFKTETSAIRAGAAHLRAGYVIVASWVRSAAAAIASGAETVAIWAMYKIEALKGAASTVAAHARMAGAWVASKVQAGISAAAAAGAWVASSARTVGAFALQTAAQVGSRAVMIASAAVIGIVTAAQWLWNAAMSANPIGIVILAIVALIAAVVWAWNNCETFRNVVMAVWGAIQTAVSAVVNWFITTVPALWANITTWTSNAWNAILAFFSGVVTSIRGFFQGVWNFLVTVFSYTPLGLIVNNWDAIVGFFTGLPGRIGSAVSGMWNGITDSFKNALNTVIRWWNDFSLDLHIPSNSVTDFLHLSGAGFSVDTPNIPLLASGALVTDPALAMLGESGHEAVLPFSRVDEFAAMVARRMGQMDFGPVSGRGSVDLPPIYVQNPFTGEYLLAQVGAVASATLSNEASAVRARPRR